MGRRGRTGRGLKGTLVRVQGNWAAQNLVAYGKKSSTVSKVNLIGGSGYERKQTEERVLLGQQR